MKVAHSSNDTTEEVHPVVVFALTMPGIGSWNGRWSGEGRYYARVKRNNEVPAAVKGQEFRYRWDEGWEACITVRKVDAREAAKLRSRSDGFLRYDWMIESIIKHGEIRKPERS